MFDAIPTATGIVLTHADTQEIFVEQTIGRSGC